MNESSVADFHILSRPFTTFLTRSIDFVKARTFELIWAHLNTIEEICGHMHIFGVNLQIC